uniref:Uncharacterized protein n=1 Tax=Callithrix jacchus TaxID=9483 RepID=A0A8I3XDM1_CALJA
MDRKDAQRIPGGEIGFAALPRLVSNTWVQLSCHGLSKCWDYRHEPPHPNTWGGLKPPVRCTSRTKRWPGPPQHFHPCRPRQVSLSESQAPPQTMQVGSWAGQDGGCNRQRPPLSGQGGMGWLEPVFPHVGHDLQGPAVGHGDGRRWDWQKACSLSLRLEQCGAKDHGEVMQGLLLTAFFLPPCAGPKQSVLFLHNHHQERGRGPGPCWSPLRGSNLDHSCAAS